jgi:peptidoglycan/xylan/chitin deacetylase (PgdA/CDA1 family)
MLATAAGAAMRLAGREPDAAARARILYYHRIDDEWHRSCVTPRAFREQMQYLGDAGFQVVPLAALASTRSLGPRAVALTFDDGFADNYERAFPVLAERGLPATIFVTVGAVGGALRVLRDRPEPLPALTWAQVREMLAGPITIGSHTLSHPHLTRLEPAAVQEELVRSREIIRSETGVATELFCYPHGDESETVRAAVAQAGYRLACSTRPGAVSSASDLLRLPRTFVARDDSLADFRRKLAGAYDVLHHGVQRLRAWRATTAA